MRLPRSGSLNVGLPLGCCGWISSGAAGWRRAVGCASALSTSLRPCCLGIIGWLSAALAGCWVAAGAGRCVGGCRAALCRALGCGGGAWPLVAALTI